MRCFLTTITTVIVALVQAAAAFAQQSPDPVLELKQEASELRSRLDALEKRIHQLESATPSGETGTPVSTDAPQQNPPPATGSTSGLLRDTTFNLLLDTYYEYNFNAPIGRVNLLRAYDVSSNSVSLNQAAVVLENAPKPDAGKRWGARLDLQWGQATQTLQGNPTNEPRPDIYRAIFQAYGTYVAPLGRGLTLDFGKWASAIGIEGNYAKDQINYSRSFWYNFLPFYHMGLRASYNLTDSFAIHYWLTNGTDQTEAFNGFKDESAGLTWQARKSVNWIFNYYVGQEHPDVIYSPPGTSAGVGDLPTQQGVPFEPIHAAPTGKLHIFDSYATWQATKALTFAADADWVIERNFSYSAPSRVTGGTIYGRYELTPKVAVGARAEYLSDRGGLFSGVTQALKETTLTADYRFAESFLGRLEWRRDFSNRPYFYSDTLGILRRQQNTVGIGLLWWFGGKEGAW